MIPDINPAEAISPDVVTFFDNWCEYAYNWVSTNVRANELGNSNHLAHRFDLITRDGELVRSRNLSCARFSLLWKFFRSNLWQVPVIKKYETSSKRPSSYSRDSLTLSNLRLSRNAWTSAAVVCRICTSLPGGRKRDSMQHLLRFLFLLVPPLLGDRARHSIFS